MKWILLFGTVLTILFLTSCGLWSTDPAYSRLDVKVVNLPSGNPTIQTPVYVDLRLSTKNKEEIYAGFEEWNFALNHYVHYTIVSESIEGYGALLADIQRTGVGVVVLKDENTTVVTDRTLAWVSSPGSRTIHVAESRIGTRSMKSILMHEVGHVLGLNHVKASNSLMNPEYFDHSYCVDERTVLELSKIKSEFSFLHMNYCVHL